MNRYVLTFLIIVFGNATTRGDDLEINLWYGEHQRFGHLGGHPQRWVNILGNVSPAGTLQSLSYSLNGDRPLALSFREDRKRIARDGDFNIELAREDLRDGPNTVDVIALGKNGTTVRRQVRLDNTESARGWPLPYQIDWSKARNIQDHVQIVDGHWKLTADGVRCDQRYYDRVLAFGDESWQDYEVSTTVTIHELTAPRQAANNTGVTHAAIALRWPGHDSDGKQPSVKWYPLGATAEFRLGGDLKQCRWRVFDGKKKFYIESKRRRELQFDTPYHMKHRVESIEDGKSRYRAKLWPAGQPQPEGWDLERIETGDIQSGSALLIAHHAEVTFGNVSVVPIQNAQPDAADAHGTDSSVAPQRRHKASNGPAQRPPNMIVILADDLGWSAVGCYGNRLVPTPNLDRLADAGVRFTDAYATPQCTPSRAALLTGTNNARNGMWHVIPWYGYPRARMTEPQFLEQLSRDEFTLPKGLRDAGYATACIGKWHLTTNQDGSYEQLQPGAARHYGFDWSPPDWDGKRLMPQDRGVDWLTNRAIEFIERNRTRPFFVYLSHHTIHGVVAAPAKLVEKYRQRGFAETGLNNATYLAAIEHLDSSVGRLLTSLDEHQLADNTIVVFVSDNGGLVRRYDHHTPVRDSSGAAVELEVNLQEFSNSPLRDGKGSVYEGGIRVPLIVRWPAVVKAGRTCSTPVHVVDLAPTLLEAAAAKIPTDSTSTEPALDGRSWMPLLRGQEEVFPKRALYWYLPLYDLNWGATPSAVIRRDDWKLIEHFGDRFDRNGRYVEGHHLELFNLKEDTGERFNVASARSAVAEQLHAKLRAWILQHQLTIPERNPRYEPRRRFEVTKVKPSSSLVDQATEK